jgi:hypothetical protein
VRRALALAALLLGIAAGAAAEAVRSEGVGSAPIPGAPGVAPRSLALDAALANAVERVAAELLRGGARPPRERELREALAPNPGRFALSYRSVSETERPRATGSGREVAVTIEAQVDRTRLADVLRRAGLLASASASEGAAPLLRIVIEPAPAWPSLAALRRRLVQLGARQTQLERVEPERVVLVIDGAPSAARLVADVAASPPPGVAVHLAGEADGVPRIRLESVPTAPAEALPPIDTPPPKR